MSTPLEHVLDRFRDSVAKFGEKPAILSGEDILSYHQLDQVSGRIAAYLSAHGIGKEDVVAVMLKHDGEIPVAIFGIMKAGAAICVINMSYPQERIDFILQDTQAKFILNEGTYEEAKAYDGEFLAPDYSLSDLALVVYTSGSTGNPKGVLLEQHVFSRNVAASEFPLGFTSEFKWLRMFPMSFVSVIMDVIAPLVLGESLHLMPPQDRLNLHKIAEFVRARGIKGFGLPPQMAKEYFRIGGTADYIVVTSERYSNFTAPAKHCYNAYGASETGGPCMFYHLESGKTYDKVPIGAAFPTAEVYLLDDEGRVVPKGEGEICVAGQIARGYLNLPELTARKFIFSHELNKRLYRTGDIGRIRPDGVMEYVQRADWMIKVSGFRVEPGEIENALLKIEGVREAIVKGFEQANGATCLCAYYRGEEIPEDQIKSVLKQSLPYYMIPAFIFRVEEFKRNTNGKVDRLSLLPPKLQNFKAEYSAPQTAAEQAVASSFEAVLEAETIGRQDDFLALGGNSLQAVKLVNLLAERTGIRLPVSAVFEGKTVAAIAQSITHNPDQDLPDRESPAAKPAALPETHLPKAGGHGPFAASSVQRRLYALCSALGESVAYNIPAVIQISGELDLARFQGAVDALVRREESLRTSFCVDNDMVLQRIEPAVTCQVEYEDLSAAALAEEDIRRLYRAFVRPFDLGSAPLLRLKVVKTGAAEYLFLDIHHIITDGESINLMLGELELLYAGGEPEEPEFSYKDFSSWQKSFDLTAQEKYWLRELAGGVPALNLPGDYARPNYRSVQGGCIREKIGADVRDRVARLGLETEATPYMILLSAFLVLLGKYAFQDEVVVGSVASGRTHADTHSMLGMFVNTLVMKGELRQEESFLHFVGRMREKCLSAFDNQDYPFELLAQKADYTRDPSRNPLFDVMFVLEENKKAEFHLGGATAHWLRMESAASVFDLTLTVEPVQDGYELAWEYCSDLFKAETIARMKAHFLNLLEEALQFPDKKLGELSLIDAAEGEKLLETFNATDLAYPQDRTIVGLFEEQVRKRPQNPAVVWGNESHTYAGLNADANILAHELRKLGVKRDDFVAILAERRYETLLAVLGVLKAGGAYVPLDPALPPERLRYILKDCNPKAVLSCGKTLPEGTALREIDLNRFRDAGYLAKTASRSRNLPQVNAPQDLCYCIYTSGTTGLPKGVMIEHCGVLNLREYFLHNHSVSPADRVLQFASFSFDASVAELAMSLLTGAALYILPEEVKEDYGLFEKYIEGQGITIAILPPQYLAQVRLKGLRTVITAGAETNPDLIRENSHIPVYSNDYGPTEATVCASFWKHPAGEPVPDRIPIGKPMNNKQLYVLQGNSLCGIGVQGELCIAGVGLARGYLHNPELTWRHFLPNPFGEGRLYRSGDLARWLPDGTLEYLGRLDDQVKIRGFRVEMGEIDRALRKIEGVRDCAVIAGREQNGDQALYAYVVSDSGLEERGELRRIRSTLRGVLPEYMIPAYMTGLAALPLNSSGKVDKGALPKIEGRTSGEYEAPASPGEKALCLALQEILGLEGIGLNDSFYELGGDSIKAIRLIAKLREKGYQLSARAVMEKGIVRDIAVLLQAGKPREEDRAEVSGSFALTPIQCDFFQACLPEKNHFNQAELLASSARIDAGALAKALAALAAQHDILRALFAGTEGLILPAESFPGIPLDIWDCKSRDQAAAYCEGLQKGLDIEQGPLARAALLRLPERDYLFLVIHHLVVDSVSWQILTEDLESAYSAAGEGKERALPAKTASFIRWSQGVESYRGSYLLRREKAYWDKTDALAASASLALPLLLPGKPAGEPADDNPGPGTAVRGELTFALAEEETAKLLYQANRAYHTRISDLLVTALVRAVHRLSGQKAVSILLEGHGREDLEPEAPMDVSRTVGWFTSLYPVVIENLGGELGAEIVNVKETLRRVPRQGIGYGILRSLDPGAKPAVKPDITLNYLGQRERRDGLFFPSRDIPSAVSAGENHFGTPLALNGLVLDRCLTMLASYDRAAFSDSLVTGLCTAFAAELKEVIAYCTCREEQMVTASDLGERVWTDEEFRAVLSQYRQEGLEIQRIYPLTSLQEGILFHKLSAEKSGAYIVQNVLSLKDEVDPGFFRQALQCLTRKHGALRTAISHSRTGEPRQILLGGREAGFTFIDISHISRAEEKNERLEEIKGGDVERGFDLESDPLLRVTLVKRGTGDHLMIWTFHHLIMDGWCLSIIFGDFSRYYSALKKGEELPEEKTGPYEDFVRELAGRDKEGSLAYWESLLHGYGGRGGIPPLGRPEGGRETAAQVKLVLAGEEVQAAARLCAAEGVTLNSVMETVLGILLQRYNYSRDVVYGKVVSGRNAAVKGIEDMVGLFINTVPLRVTAGAEDTFLTLLHRLQQQGIESGEHDFCALAEIQSQSGLGKELVEVILAFENYYFHDMEGYGRLFALESVREETGYGLTFSVAGDDREIRLSLLYDTRKYGREEAALVLGHWGNLFRSAVAAPESLLSGLEMAGEEEIHRLTFDFNDCSRVEYPRDKSVVQLFEEQVERTPDRIALRSAEKVYTYAELNQTANKIASRLRRDYGVQPGDFVAIMTERRAETVAGIVGIIKSGGAYVPLNSSFPAERRAQMLSDCRPKAVLTVLEPTDTELPVLQIQAAQAWDLSPENPPRVNKPEDLAYLIYTSGTTGQGKGVMIEHRSIVNLVSRPVYTVLDEHTELLHTGQQSFDASTLEIWGCFLNGGCGHLVRDQVLLNPEALRAYLADYQINTMFLTTALFNQLADTDPGIFDPLEHLMFGGEKTVEKYVDKLRAVNPALDLRNVYGPTETTTFALHYPILARDAKTPIGQPINNTRLYILDGKRLCGIGVPGELCIAGDGLSRGYLNQPELTAEKFESNPWGGGRIYRSGDLVRRLPDGNVEFLRRIDAQVKIRGFRIELSEIDDALRQIDGVQECAVTVSQDSSGDRVILAYVVFGSGSGQGLSPAQIREALRETLPAYMIPARIALIDSIPLNSSGKLDKKSLPPVGLQADTEYQAPENEAEEAVCVVFAEILGVGQVGVKDNFFELGGDSIKAIRIVSKLRARGWQTAVKAIMNSKSAAGLAAGLQPVRQSSEGNQAEDRGGFRLTAVQKEFMATPMSNPNHFNQSQLLKCSERLEEEVLHKALAVLAGHHDLLRATFAGRRPYVHPAAGREAFPLAVYDCKSLEEAVRYGNELQGGLDIAQGPLARGAILRLPEADYLLLVIHHLVVDGVSWRLLTEDLGTAYSALQEGRPALLPGKTASFRSWSAEVYRYRESYLLKKELPYWQKIEASLAAGRLALPGGRESRDWDQENFRAEDLGVHSARLDAGATEVLLYRAHKAYNTQINDLLVTALLRAVRSLTGQKAVGIRMEGHGREEIGDIDVGRTVGWFTSLYPIFIESRSEDLGAEIINVKETLRRIPNHGLGYGILRNLAEEAEEVPPLPDISFNYLGQSEKPAGIFALSRDIVTQEAGGGNFFGTPVSINSFVFDHCLGLVLAYDKRLFSDGTMGALTENFRRALLEVLGHCSAITAPVTTASDYGETVWTEEEFRAVVRAYAQDSLEIERLYPLTPLQEGMLFHKLSAGDSTGYVVQQVLGLRRALDLGAFREALDRLTKKHGALRTAITHSYSGEPRQVLFRSRPMGFEFIDLSAAADQAASLEEIKGRDLHKGFALEHDPLLRVTLVKRAERDYALIWTYHHIIMDGWCLSIVFGDFWRFYLAAAAKGGVQEAGLLGEGRPGRGVRSGGEERPDGEEHLDGEEHSGRYEDFVRSLQDRDGASSLAYWADLLAGYEQRAGIRPLGKPRGGEESGARADIYIAGQEVRAAARLCAAEGVTLNTLMEAVLGILLQRYNRTDDVVFGKVVSGRNAPVAGIEDMVGLFINTVPVRVTCAREDSFITLLRKLQAQAIAGSEHDYCPLAEIQNKSRLGSDLIGVLLAFENYYTRDLVEYGRIFTLESAREETDYALSFTVTEEGEKIHIGLLYAAASYGREDIGLISQHLSQLFRSAVTAPETPVSELTMLSEEEIRRTTKEFNPGEAEYPRDKTLVELFEEQVGRTPDRIALVFNGATLTYRELNAKANALAYRLREMGVRPDDLVALYAERSLEMVIAIYGVLKSGGAYVPINTFYPPARVSYILEDCRPKVILTRGPRPPASGVPVLELTDASLYSGPPENPPRLAGPENLAYVIYTSGTTGRPKGVLIEQANVVRLFFNSRFPFDFQEQDVWLMFHSYGFDFSVWEMYGAGLFGGKLVIPSEETVRDSAAVMELIRREGVTVLNQVPSSFYNLLQEDEEGRELQVRYLIFGGEALNPARLVNWARRHPQTRIVNMYGITETTVHVTYREIGAAEIAAGRSDIGRALPTLGVYVLNGNRPCGIGVPGELCVTGAGLGRGYLNRPELTAEKFSPNPWGEGRLYRSGDLARWLPDGNLEYLGRLDAQVKIHGFRIELGDIEAALREIDAVGDCVVIADREEEGDTVLKAYIVPARNEAGRELKFAALRAELKKTLPQYMLPSYLTRIEAIPLTGNGKLDRSALPRIEVHSEAAFAAPENPGEKALCQVFEEILGAENCGLNDSFFELGGDSIKAIRMVAKLREKGWQTDVKAIMQSGTVRELAASLRSFQGPGEEEQEFRGEFRPTAIQCQFFNTPMPNPNHFNQSELLVCSEAVDEEALRQALAALAAHHDLLRATFAEGRPYIRGLEGEEAFPLSVFPCASREEAKARGDALAGQLNIETGPIARAALLRLPEQEYILLIVHHLAIDGVSWRILTEDLATAYAAAQGGREGNPAAGLPAKTASFARWSEAVYSYRDSYRLRKELPYWQKTEALLAAGAGGFADPEQKSEQGTAGAGTALWGLQSFVLAAEATEKLLYRANKAWHTQVGDLLVTALLRAVYNLTGQHSLGLELEGHGREEIGAALDIGRTVGWFTTLYPVVFAGLGGELEDEIIRVKETLRRVPNHGIGYGIWRSLAESPAAGETPAAQPEITFNYLGQSEPARGIFAVSQDIRVRDAGGANRFGTPVSINAAVFAGCLHIYCQYDRRLYGDGFMSRLTAGLAGELKEVIACCAGAEEERRTASDYGETLWTEKEFRAVCRAYAKGGLEIQRIYPLTPLQEGMLFHKLEKEQGTDYVVQSVLGLGEAPDPAAFSTALSCLAAKHSVLRTAVVYRQVAEPRQLLLGGREIEFRQRDLSGERERARLYEELRAGDVERGFDLEADPLLRVTLVKMSGADYRLIWTFHHIIMDGWCLSILFGDFLRFYSAAEKGLEIRETARGTYEEFVRALEDKDREKSLTYWEGLLEDYDTKAEIRPQEKGDNSRDVSAMVHLYVEGEEGKKAEALCAAQGVTLNTLVEAALGILLQRYNFSSDVVYGKVVSGRNPALEGIEDMIGLFINTVPVRVRSEEGQSFAGLLRALQSQALAGGEHDDCPLTAIQQRSAPGSELIGTILAFENYYRRDIGHGGLPWTPLSQREQTNYPISFNAVAGEGRIDLGVMYDTGQFSEREARRVLAHLGNIIRSAVNAPEAPVAEISLTDEEERRRILQEFNGPTADYPRDLTAMDLFEEQVRRDPEHTAVFYGKRRMSYRELNERSNSLARLLRQRYGIGPGKFVALIAGRSPELLIAVYAILKAGGAYVPIDPNYPRERIAFMLADCGAALVLKNLPETFPDLAIPQLDLTAEENYAASSAALAKLSGPADLMYLIYTSGTTGLPKGVMVEQRNFVSALSWKCGAYPLDKNDVLLQKTNYIFDASLWEMFWWSVSGASVAILEAEAEKDPALICEAIREYGVTAVDFVPPVLNIFLEELAAREKPEDYAAALKYVSTGGEALSAGMLARFNSVVRRRKPEVALINFYGPTETTIAVTHYLCGEEEQNVPIGKPFGNSQAYILSGKTLCGVGVPGELCIAGDCLTRGYLGRPELTAEKFVLNPFGPGKMYRTGDLARWRADGNIEYLGRIDDQVKVRGLRIELGEIDSALRKLAGVRDCAVLVRRDHNGDKGIYAYIVAEQAGGAEPPAVREALGRVLPDYMVPAYIANIEAIPVKASGKVDSKALPDIQAGAASGYVPPENAGEEAVCQVFSEVLGAGRVGREDSFFEIGGDSIKGIRIIARLSALGYALRMRDIFNHPVVKDLAALLVRQESLADNGEVRGEAALSPIQRWFFSQDLDNEEHYNQSFLLRAAGRIDLSILARALDEIVRHHDVLRASFRRENGLVKQFIEPFRAGGFWGLAGAGEGSDPGALLDQAEKSMKLEGAKLQAVILRGRGREGDRLFLAVHHLVIDTVSWRILLEDLSRLYAGMLEGKTPSLPDKTTSYQAWGAALREYAASDRLHREIPYWSAPGGKAQRAVEAGEAGTAGKAGKVYRLKNRENFSFTLPAPETLALVTRAPRKYRTQINDLLLAALMEAFRRTKGAGELTVLLEGHGREDFGSSADVSRTVGWFTTFYPVVLKAGGSLADTLIGTKETLRGVPNRGFGYSALRYLRGEAALEVEADIQFNYLGEFSDSRLADGTKVFELAPLEPFEPAGGVEQERKPGGQGVLRRPADVDPESTVMTGGEITAYIQNGVFHGVFSCDGETYGAAAGQRLSAAYRGALRDMIAHCTDEGVPRLWTPADFNWPGLDRGDFARIMAGLDPEGIEEIYPLSNLQKGMLLLYERFKTRNYYFEQSLSRVTGLTDPAEMKERLRRVTDKYAILRTYFVSQGLKQPYQVVLKQVEPDFIAADLSGLSREQQEIYLQRLRQEDRAYGFDTGKAPLLRMIMVRLGDQESVLIVSFLHAILDRWSLEIIEKELFSGDGGTMEKEVPKYSAYIRWLSLGREEESKVFWRNYLAGSRDMQLSFAGASGRGAVSRGTGAQGTRGPGAALSLAPAEGEAAALQFELSSGVTDQIRALCSAQAVTPSTFIQCAWGLTLMEHLGSYDVTFGYTLSGRPAEIEGIENMAGMFINTLPVRIRWQQGLKPDSTSFSQLLKKTQADFLEIERYSATTVAEIQAAASLPHPAFRSFVTFQNTNPEGQSEEGPRVTLEGFSRNIHDFSLAVSLAEKTQILFNYEPGKYAAEDMKLLAELFEKKIREVLS